MKFNKRYYYVVVLSSSIDNDVMKFVYEEDNIKRVCYWGTFKEMREKDKHPLQYNKTIAEETALCLGLNGYLAMVLCSPYELK